MAKDAELLSELDGAAVECVNEDASSDIVLVCEHGSHRIPRSLDNLGLGADALGSHIAWDVGAQSVAREMARVLDATLILQRFSRLVYDCNRPPRADDAIARRSERVPIPGNQVLTNAARRARLVEIYLPFRNRIATTLASRMRAGRAPVVVTVHSFTPEYDGCRRHLDVGVVHDEDRRLADILLASASWPEDWVVRRNQPYGPSDGVTHTLCEHALPLGLPNVMFEICNDHIADVASTAAVARRLAWLLAEAVGALRRSGKGDRNGPRAETKPVQ